MTGMRNRPPKWVKLWLSDLHGSSAKARLSGQAWLLYCAFLMEQPQVERLPSDPTALALHFKLDPAWASPLIEEIRGWLTEDDGGLYSERMEAEIGKCNAAIKAASDKGKKGGKASGAARQPKALVEAGAQAGVEPEHEAGVEPQGQAQVEPSQSQSQNQSSTDRTDSPAPAARDAVDTLPGLSNEPPAPPKPKRRRKPTGPQAEAIDWWCAEFQRLKGTAYAFAGAKDGAHIKAMLGWCQGDLDAFKARATAILTSTDPFFAEKGVDLGLLRNAWNRLGSSGRAPTSNKPMAREDWARYEHLRPPRPNQQPTEAKS